MSSGFGFMGFYAIHGVLWGLKGWSLRGLGGKGFLGWGG